MKILHIDETFHPSYGYQVNPLAKFQQHQGNEVYIATVDKEHLYPVYKEFEILVKLLIRKTKFMKMQQE